MPYLVYYFGNGYTNNDYSSPAVQPISIGPAITLANSGSLTLSDVEALPYTGAITVASRGANGTTAGRHDYVGDFYAYLGATGGTVSIINSGNVTVSGLYSPFVAPIPTAVGIDAYSFGGNGGYYDTKASCCAGSGGNGGAVSVTTTAGSNITLGNLPDLSTAAIQALSIGGQPATVSFVGSNTLSGYGGNGGPVTVDHAGAITVGSNGVGIVAGSIGGSGTATTVSGSGGPVTVTLEPDARIAMTGVNGIGVFATSTVGAKSGGWQKPPVGGSVTVTLQPGSSIATTGNGLFGIGVLAVSSGSASILEPFNGSSSVNTSGGGFSGTVQVTNNGQVSTSGATAVGVAALSIGGAGIVTSSNSSSGVSYLGNSGSGYDSQGSNVTVANTGTISTNGNDAHGILAISAGGGGILATDTLPQITASNGKNTLTGGLVIGGDTSSDSGGHGGGTVNVTNSGSITTGDTSGHGLVAMGILAQSIGGGGGTSAGNGAAAFLGDAGGSGGNGGAVTVTNSGPVTTYNDAAHGILAQSIGGGGGNGANAYGAFVALGGAGGNGGGSGTVSVSLNAPAPGATANIASYGDFADGVLEQSVGGGGGNGGFAKSYGLFVSGAIGGTGGGGGAGGEVDFTNQVGITTAGLQAHGVTAQSIGGGGGNGGAAHSTAVGLVASAAIAVGGSGGGGGGAGIVNAANDGIILTSGGDAIGLEAQSVGGGGGNGGDAIARTLAIGVPEIPTVAFSAAIGGSGGSGGLGNAVTVTNTGTIATMGDAAHGILAQSIGGGGGNGGDSTAASFAVDSSTTTARISLDIGGRGGASGYSTGVSVTNGATTPGSPTALITTIGNNSAGIVAQSIGGGGGNGGAGNTNSNSPNVGKLNGETDDAMAFTLAIGGGSGASGYGGSVTVANESNGVISTIGSGAQGILAQAIGGGGGNGGGGAASGGGDSDNFNLSVGAKGASGSSTGTVSVSNAGRITTGKLWTIGGQNFVTGGDSVGIMAQSIGGGGGAGGTSDAAATNGPVTQTGVLLLGGLDDSYIGNISVGGSAGAGGSGGTVQVTNTGSVTTYGARAYGILAQSIGGGGGSGGNATTTANSVLGGQTTNEGDTENGTFAASLSIGGSGGASGNGGPVTVTNGSTTAPGATIMTAGYASHGILAQSIGGGGGVGGEGTVNNSTSIGLGAGLSGGGGGGGNGGNVTVNNYGTIFTAGDDGYGVLAQSIGGGGGMASTGCSNSTASAAKQPLTASACAGNSKAGASGSVSSYNDSSSFALNVGGAPGTTGNGGGVVLNAYSGNIVTTGARAFGIAAQSIGGGGGLGAAAAINLRNTNLQSQPGQNAGKGGAVTVQLDAPGSITTFGAGAWGILAQSVGGGGGFAGDSSLAMQMPQSNTLNDTPASQSNTNYAPDGGALSVTTGGTITTTGANAHGIVAQSVGGGGGIAAGCCNSPTAVLLAGNSAQIYSVAPGPFAGEGGAITIDQTGGTIRTLGPGSIAIVAQSTGKSDYTQPINVTIGGTVIGGTNAGYAGGVGAAGILLSGGVRLDSVAPATANLIIVNGDGVVTTMDGTEGTAITTDYGLTNVNNAGTISGSINLGSTPGTIVNTGLLNTGPTLVASLLTNNGIINVAGGGVIGTTALTGNLAQDSGGVLGVDVNSLTAQKADLLTVSGNAQLAGTVVPDATALLPGAVPIVTASTLSVTAQAQSSLLFNWSLPATPTSVALSPSANFTPQGVPLTRSEASLAGYLTKAWNNSDSQFATTFGYLSHVSSGSQYAAALGAWSARATQALPAAMANSGSTLLGSAMSCPVFVDQGTLLGEDSCVWAKLTGQWTNQYSNGGDGGYSVSGTTYRLGGQREIAPNWFLGGSIATGVEWAQEGDSSSHGTTYDGSLAVKHTIGPWMFAGSVALASGSFQTNRLLDLPAIGTAPGFGAPLQSDSSIFLAGGRVRGAYDFSFGDWYVRPYGDLDVVYTHAPGFQESGPRIGALNIGSSDQTSAVLSPMVEFGGRYNVNRTTILRPYVAAGVSFLPNNTRVIDASFAGGLGADGTFQTFIKSPSVLGKLDVGVQLYQVGGFEVRAEYSVMSGSAYLSQSASARLAFHF